jgi:hypothetical protein
MIKNVFVEETQGHSKPTGLSQVVLGGLLGQSLIQPNNVKSTHETYLKNKDHTNNQLQSNIR